MELSKKAKVKKKKIIPSPPPKMRLTTANGTETSVKKDMKTVVANGREAKEARRSARCFAMQCSRLWGALV